MIILDYYLFDKVKGTKYISLRYITRKTITQSILLHLSIKSCQKRMTKYVNFFHLDSSSRKESLHV